MRRQHLARPNTALPLLLCWVLSAQAAEESRKPHDCIRLQYLGVCVWLVCYGPYCTTKTSPKWGHFNPDLVVSVTNGTVQGGIESGTAGSPHRQEGFGRGTNLSYRSAEAVGHPLAGMGYCPSAASALKPYYLSSLDTAAWDWSIPEVAYPESLVPGLREIGGWPLQSWGAVYPRSGWTLQPEEPKGAAINAQRVGDIVTRSGQPHLYLELESGGVFFSDNKLVWRPPEPLNENDARGGDWELVDPSADPGQCQTFGANDLATPAGWSAGKLSKTGDYVYTLWRPYACCEVKGTFLFDAAIPYPPP